jgi:hypothetical protein
MNYKHIFQLTLIALISFSLSSYSMISVAKSEDAKVSSQASMTIEMNFDKEKWQIKEGKDYPYRDAMLNDIVYTDKFRKLNKNEILEVLGEPTYYRDDKNYLHYIITQTRLLSWPLHTKVLVIKISEDSSVEWIKIHK